MTCRRISCLIHIARTFTPCDAPLLSVVLLSPQDTTLCCAVLCCAVLCCAVLCCAVLCCAVLCCAVLCGRRVVIAVVPPWLQAVATAAAGTAKDSLWTIRDELIQWITSLSTSWLRAVTAMPLHEVRCRAVAAMDRG